MRRHLHAVPVCLVDRRAQFLAADPGVRLEPGHPLLGPVAHETAGLLRPLELGHRLGTLLSRQVGTRREHVGADGPPLVDRALEVDLLVRSARAGRPDRRHAGGEVEPRPRERELRRPPVAARVVAVVVQPDQTRDHGVTLQVEDLRVPDPVRDLVGGADVGDAAVPDHDGLAFAGGTAGAIDHLHIRERDGRRLHRDEAFHRFLLRPSAGGKADREARDGRGEREERGAAETGGGHRGVLSRRGRSFAGRGSTAPASCSSSMRRATARRPARPCRVGASRNRSSRVSPQPVRVAAVRCTAGHAETRLGDADMAGGGSHEALIRGGFYLIGNPSDRV